MKKYQRLPIIVLSTGDERRRVIMSTSTISQSLFRATVKKEGLECLVKEIDGIASQQLYTSFVHRFLKKNISCDYLWEGLANIDQKIEGDVEKNLIFILDKMNVAEKDVLFLMSDQWRDPICLSTQKKHLRRLIESVWYPSDDLYIFDEEGT
jgi:hypothetical protein